MGFILLGKFLSFNTLCSMNKTARAPFLAYIHSKCINILPAVYYEDLDSDIESFCVLVLI